MWPNNPSWDSNSNHCTNRHCNTYAYHVDWILPHVIFVNYFADDILFTPAWMCMSSQKSMWLDCPGMKFGIAFTNLAVVCNKKRWFILWWAKIELPGIHPCLFHVLMTSSESLWPYISAHAFTWLLFCCSANSSQMDIFRFFQSNSNSPLILQLCIKGIEFMSHFRPISYEQLDATDGTIDNRSEGAWDCTISMEAVCVHHSFVLLIALPVCDALPGL